MHAISPGETYRSTMEAEFARWKDTTPTWRTATGAEWSGTSKRHPYAGDLGGLPDGWHSRFIGPYLTFDDTDLHLIQRTDGGVAVVRCERDISRNTLWQTADSLLDLDAWLHSLCDDHDKDDPAQPPLAATVFLRDWVRTCLISLYNQDDPGEAAEQTLLALGGRLRTPPRATF